MLRLWFPYADPDADLLLHINYFTPDRRFVWTPERGRVQPASTSSSCVHQQGAGVPPGCVPSVGDGAAHGSYVWHQLHSVMYVKMKGGRSLEVRTEPVIEVSATLALSVEDFYADRYVENVAFVLGIDPARIKVQLEHASILK